MHQAQIRAHQRQPVARVSHSFPYLLNFSSFQDSYQWFKGKPGHIKMETGPE